MHFGELFPAGLVGLSVVLFDTIYMRPPCWSEKLRFFFFKKKLAGAGKGGNSDGVGRVRLRREWERCWGMRYGIGAMM